MDAVGRHTTVDDISTDVASDTEDVAADLANDIAEVEAEMDFVGWIMVFSDTCTGIR